MHSKHVIMALVLPLTHPYHAQAVAQLRHQVADMLEAWLEVEGPLGPTRQATLASPPPGIALPGATDEATVRR